MEALKQLFLKIIGVVILIETEGHKSKRKDERRRELEEYTKVFCNFLSIEDTVRDKILSDLKK